MTDYEPDPTEPGGGTLAGWDDELNDWTEDDHVTASQATERLHDLAFAGDKCIRHKPPTLDACTQGYDHTGPCTWFAEANRRGYTIADVGAHLRHDRAQQAYTAVTDQQAAAEFDAAEAHIAGYLSGLTDDLLPPTHPRGQHRIEARGYCDEAP